MKKDLRKKILIIFGITVIFLATGVNKIDINISYNDNYNLKAAKSWNLTGAPILIDDLDPTRDWAYTESNYDWCSGAGTLANPYVIENVTIDGQFSSSCIEIRNSNAYFIIRNCTLYHSGYVSFFDPDAGIKLDQVTNGILDNNNCSFNFLNGIYLSSSDDITISGNTLNNNYNGIFLEWSDSNIISGNIIENNVEYGIYLEWADSITLSGNNMTKCGLGLEGALSYISSHSIDTSNLVSEKPIYYYINTVGLLPGDFINAGQIILVNCDNSIIADVEVSHGSCGIALYFCEGNAIRDLNSSYNTDRGIYLRESNGNIIVYNNAHNNGHGTQYHDRGGIVLSLSSSINISFNYANYNSKGISMQLGINNTLYNNTANYNTQCGIHLDSSNARMYMNRMKLCGVEIHRYASTYTIPISNEVNGKPVYYYRGTNNLLPTDFNNPGQIILVNCNNSLISDLDVSYGSCGISLFNCHDNIISYNNASYSTIYGLSLDWLSYNNNVSKNKFIDNLDEGILINGNYNLISKNIIRWNKLNLYSYAGILVYGDSNNLTANEISRNNRYGISLMGNNNTVSENNILKNYIYGISLGADKNKIINNNISNNRDTGVRIYYSNDNIFTGNHIENNTLYGIDLSDENCVNNYFYNNLFIDNGIQASDDSTPNTNFWDNGNIGNYWDDYSGVDADDDGIGDDPYNITGTAGSQDNFPIWDDGPEAFKIYINGLATGVGAPNWTWAVDQWWCYGAGTLGVPYIIEDLIIDSQNSGNCIEIINSNAYFIIRNCTLIDSGDGNAGIKLWNTNNGKIINNTCSSNYHGIFLDNISSYNTIAENIAIGNSNMGIWIYSSDNNIIRENVVKNNVEHGILVEESKNNTISKNSINSNTQDGVRISSSLGDHSEYNIILRNNISNNIGSGIFVEQYSDYNLVYLNRIIDNNFQALDNGGNNKWDNNSIGNYWNDYSGIDANDDGHGDTPYNILGTAGARDIYPIWWDPPVFSITSPINSTIFKSDSPDFDINIVEGIPDTMWYTLNDGSTKYFFTTISGKINQSAWIALSNGIVNISFFIEDSRGYITSNNIYVQKQVPSSDVIHGYNTLILIYSMMLLITLILIIKFKNKSKINI